MKKIFTLFAVITALGAVLTGCNRAEEEGTPAGSRDIRFSASVGTFQVKATDTAFEEGDEIGLFAEDPINVINAKLNITGGVPVPEEAIRWGEYQLYEQPTYFYAYYPYFDGAGESDNYRHAYFEVAADQSTHAAFTASDLMVARAQSAPADGAVQLNFAHALSKIVFTVEDVSNPDAQVASVKIGNVVLGCEGWLGEIGSFYGTGYEDIVTAGQVVLPTRADTAPQQIGWAAILPPQDTYPIVSVTMADGTQYSFNTSGSVVLQASRRYNVKITIDGSTASADFGASVSDWIDNGDIEFGQFGESDVWSMIGTLYNSNWDVDYDLSPDGDTYYGEFYYEEGQEFKFRNNHDWGLNYGIGDWTGENFLAGEDTYYLVADGANITLDRSGTWFVAVNFNEGWVSFECESGEVGPEQPQYELDQLQPIVDTEDGVGVTFTQMVYAVCTRGFVVYDGKYGIFVYTGQDSGVEVGQILTVNGEKTTYNGVPEITNPSFTTYGYDQPMEIGYEDVTSFLDQDFASIAIPICIEGVLGTDGYTIYVEDQTYNGSVYYARDDMGFSSLKNHNVIVYGFYNGFAARSQAKYIVATAVQDLGEVEEEQPEVPGETVFLAFETDDLKAMPAGGETIWLDNIISISNDSSYGSTAVTEMRIYKGKTLTISAADGYEIVLVQITCTANGTTKYGPGSFGNGAPDGYSYDGANGLWTGNESELSFTATDNQVRIAALKIGYVAVQ